MVGPHPSGCGFLGQAPWESPCSEGQAPCEVPEIQP